MDEMGEQNNCTITFDKTCHLSFVCLIIRIKGLTLHWMGRKYILANWYILVDGESAHPVILWTETVISGLFVPPPDIWKTRAAKSDGSVNPFITIPPTGHHKKKKQLYWNHPVNQTRPCVCFWWDAGAGNTIWSLPGLISVIDWNNRRSETMKQPHYVCPCHITSVWMVLTRKEALFHMWGSSTVAMQGLAGTASKHVCAPSIKVWRIQASEW